MDDRRTPMEAEVQELSAQREPVCPEDFYGTAARPQARRDHTWAWISLGLAVIAISTFSVVATLLNVRVETRDGAWRLSLQGQEETQAPEDPVRSLEVAAADTYTPEVREVGNVGLQLSETEGEALTASEVYAQVSPAVVCVEVESYYGIASYTGVILSSDGFILSATDGLTNAVSITVSLAEGETLPANRVGEDRLSGICLLKVDAQDLPTVVLSTEQAAVGQRVYCLCSPYGSQLQNLFYEGMLSLSRTVEVSGRSCTVLQTSSQLSNVGNGCPILDSRGRVLGLTTPIGKRLVSGEDPCLALSVEDLLSVIVTFEGDGSGETVWLGLEVEDIPEDYLYLYGFPGSLWISDVALGSAPYGVLYQYDIITAVDGTEVTSAADFNRLLAAHSPGDRVKLTIYRSGKWYTIILPVITR